MDILLYNDLTFRFFEKTISQNSSDYLQRVFICLLSQIRVALIGLR